MFKLLISVIIITLLILLGFIIFKLFKSLGNTQTLDEIIIDLENKIDHNQKKYESGIKSAENLVNLYKDELKKVKELKQKLNK